MYPMQKMGVCIATGILLLSPMLVFAQTVPADIQNVGQQVSTVMTTSDEFLTSLGSFFLHLLGGIHIFGGINFGSIAITSGSSGSSGSSGAAIPVLAPPASWNGTDCMDEATATPGYCGPAAVDTTQHGSGYALEPAASWTEPPHMWITSGCDGYCTGNNYTIGVVGGDADRAGIDHVTFYLEGSTTVVGAPTKDPRTGVYGWFVNVQSSNANGDAYMVADAYPTNGYVRRLLPLHVILDTDATGFITRQTYYLNYPGCNDTYNGTSSGTSWCHLSYAMTHALNGAVVIVKAGTTLYEDLAPINVYPDSPGYNPCRMITVTSSSPGPSGTRYTITRTDIHENSEEWQQSACAIMYDSATIDNSKLPIVYASLRNQTVGFRNTTFTEPAGFTSGGPDLSSPNCQSEAAYPCLYGTSEFPGGLGKVLIDDSGGSNSFWIDSPGSSHMTQSGAFSLVRGVGYADVGEMVFAYGATPAIGTVPSFAILNSTFNQENAEPDRISSNWANNLLVSATTTSFTPIHYCDNRQTGGPFTGGVTEATTTVVELTQTPVTWTASFSGATMTVTSALSPSTPILQRMYFGDGTVTGGIKQMAYLNGSGQETFTLLNNWTGPSTDTVTSAGFNANGDDIPNGGYFLGGNEQYAVFGVGSNLVGGAVMPLWIEGNNDTGSDWVGNSGTCNGVTLVRAGHPFLLLTDNNAAISGETPPGGYIYADDTSWAGDCPIAGVFCSNIVDINGGHLSGYSPGVSGFGVLNANNQSSCARAGCVPQPGDSVLLYDIAHPDDGFFEQTNSTSENYQNFVVQQSMLRANLTQPMLFQTGHFTDTTTVNQSGTTLTADQATISNISGGSAQTTLSLTGPSWTTWTPSAAGGGHGASVRQNGVITITSAGGGSYNIQGTTVANAPAFNRGLVAGSRIFPTGANCVWQIDAVIDDINATGHPLCGGETPVIPPANTTYNKVTVAAHFVGNITLALAGLELPLAAVAQTSPNLVITDPSNYVLNNAANGDELYITPGFTYGDMVKWITCVGNSAYNGTTTAIALQGNPYTFTMARSVACGTGSSFYQEHPPTSIAYIDDILASDTGQQPNTGSGSQDQTVDGLLMAQVTYFGAYLNLNASG